LIEIWESFRFTDSKLQSSHAKTIEEAKIRHRVASNGTIYYSPENSIENFIEKIINTVFQNGYYRVEISDKTKADRYRRFKKFKQTPLIEEIRSGKTYFVQKIFEKIYRNINVPTNVSYCLVDEDLIPDRVTEQLGITPTFSCMKGESFTRPYSKRQNDATPIPCRKGWWEICSIPQVESNDIEEHILWLLNILEPVSSDLHKIINIKSVENDVALLQINIVNPKPGTGGFSITGELMKRLSELIDRTDIWVFDDDYI